MTITTYSTMAGTIGQPYFVSAGSLLTVIPSQGATAFIEYTLSDLANIRNGVATWSLWTKGQVTQQVTDLFKDSGYVRMTSLSASSILQIDDMPNATQIQDYSAPFSSVDVAVRAAAFAARPAILAGDFGASFNELADQFGLDFATPTNITGVAPCRASMQTATGSALLEYRAADRSMRVTLPGELTGSWVLISDGIFQLPSGSTANTMRVSITSRLLPAVDQSDTLASGTRYWRRPNGSWKYQISAALFEQIQWLPTFGIGGNQSSDIAKRMNPIINSGANVMIMNVSGNDYITGNIQVPQSTAITMSNGDQVLAKGIPVILQLLPPRYGKDAAGANLAFTGEYTAARQGNMTTGNRSMRNAAYSRQGMFIADPSKAIDPLSAQGAIFNGYTSDGKHPAGGLAHVIMLSNLAPLRQMFGAYAFSPTVGAGDYYSATLNPGGNLLNSNQGAFAGSTGTKNAGITNTAAWAAATVQAARSFVISNGNLYYTEVGGTTGAVAPAHTQGAASDGGVSWTFQSSGAVAGLGDNFSATIEGTGVTATVHSITEPDGTRWQEVIIFGGPADGNGLRLSPQAISGSTITALTDKVTCEIDWKIMTNPKDCYGVFLDCVLTGGLSVIWDNNSMQSIQQGMQIDAGRTSLEPIVWPAGVTNVQPRFHPQVKANGVTRVRMNNFTTRKVI